MPVFIIRFADEINQVHLREYRISEHWFRTGEGEMYSDEEEISLYEITSLFKSLTPKNRNLAVSLLKTLDEHQDSKKNSTEDNLSGTFNLFILKHKSYFWQDLKSRQTIFSNINRTNQIHIRYYSVSYKTSFLSVTNKDTNSLKGSTDKSLKYLKLMAVSLDVYLVAPRPPIIS